MVIHYDFEKVKPFPLNVINNETANHSLGRQKMKLKVKLKADKES